MKYLMKLLRMEPAALTAAITATIGLLTIFGVNPDVTGAITVAIGLWLTVLRGLVTPNDRVALTVDDVSLIEAAEGNRDE